MAEKELNKSALYWLMAKKGLTVVDLSNLSGIDRVSITHWENGVRSPTLKSAYKISDALGVSVQEAFPPENEEQKAPGWRPYPEQKPVNGWCATSDGGDIDLVMWTTKNEWAEDRGIIEFMQVNRNV